MLETVDNILSHEKQIIKNGILLRIGYFREEGFERRNKIYKHDRLHRARKANEHRN